jgi:tRNA splicing endonuclease
MLSETKNPKGFFTESDAALAKNFLSAGMGAEQGGKAIFHPLEAAYLVKIGKTSFEKFASADEFAAAQAKKAKSFPFAFAFAAYSQIRSGGRLVRPYLSHTNFFRVYAPGVGREEGRPSQLLCLLPGKIPPQKSLSEQVKVAHLARLDLVIATGTEKEIKYYKISSFNW